MFRSNSLMMSSANATSISWKKSKAGLRNRTTSSCRGEGPTCRGLPEKFKRLASVWEGGGIIRRSDSALLEGKVKALAKELENRNDFAATIPTVQDGGIRVGM